MKHCMLDLETWGTVPGVALRSVGAMTFELTSETGCAEFYRNIDDVSCVREELPFDENTVKWWSAPERAEAAKVFEVAKYPIRPVIEDFHHFFTENNCEFIWSQGSSFDIVLWEALCRKLEIKIPWDFRNARDTRTVYHIKCFDSHSVTFIGTPHHALHDARHQVSCILRALCR